MSQTVLWSQTDGVGLEYCEFKHNSLRIKGHVVTEIEGTPMSINYDVRCDDAGATEFVNVIQSINGTHRTLTLTRSPEDRWFRDGLELVDFRGAKDIDLGVTPSTNTLPIQRLSLEVGEAKELTALWVRFPDLSLAPLRQKYRRVHRDTYIYESIVSGYCAEIQVDEFGVVRKYGDVWERVPVVRK